MSFHSLAPVPRMPRTALPQPHFPQQNLRSFGPSLKAASALSAPRQPTLDIRIFSRFDLSGSAIRCSRSLRGWLDQSKH
jgi:hypothetical protein